MQIYKCLLIPFFVLYSTIYAQEKDILNVAVSKIPNSMDPIKNWHYLDDEIIEPTIETLVRINQKGNIVGDLAKKWRITNRGKKYKFTLRSSYFVDGSLVTAQDVVFSLRRQVRGDSIGIEGQILTNLVAGPESIYSKNNHVFIDLKKPYLPFIQLLSRPMYGIVKKQKKITVPPITSGKFQAQFNKNNTVLMLSRRNKSKILINKIIIRKISRKNSIKELNEGKIDLVLGHTYTKEESKKMKSAFTRTKLESLGTLHLYTNINGPLKNDSLRKKVCHSLKEVVNNASFDPLYLKKAGHYLPKGIMPHSYYQDRDIKIYKKSFLKREKIKIILRKEYISDDYAMKIRKTMSNFFREVTIKRMYIADIIPILKNKTYDLALIGFYGFLADPDGYLTPFQSKAGIQIGMFQTQKNNLMNEISKARSNLNRKDRLILYNDIMTRFENDCYVIPQYYVDFPVVVNKRLEIDRIKFQYTTLFENIRWKR